MRPRLLQHRRAERAPAGRFDDWVRYNIENNSSFYEMHASAAGIWVTSPVTSPAVTVHAKRAVTRTYVLVSVPRWS